MQIGRFPDGVLAEVFLDAAKPSSALDAFSADAAILISLLLQHGAGPGLPALAAQVGLYPAAPATANAVCAAAENERAAR